MSGHGRRTTCERCGRRWEVNHARPQPERCPSCRHRANAPLGDWTERAACRGLDTKEFYAYDEAKQRQAKRVCAECPVVVECLAYALANNEQGVWGGATENERRRMQGKRPKTWERGERSTRKPSPPPSPAPSRITVRKDGDWWAVTHRAQEAKAASWDAAIDFANRIATTQQQ